MRYHITAKQKDFFCKNGFLEFADLTSSEQVASWAVAFHKALSTQPTGRDLSRSLPTVRRELLSYSLHEPARALVGCPTLRWAFDDYYEHSTPASPTLTTLAEMGSVQGIVGGLVLRLAGECLEETPTMVPQKVGHTVVLAADFPFPWARLAAEPTGAFLVIAYAHENAVYIHNPRDRHTHDLKQLGYAIGDRLRDETHPCLTRLTRA